MSEVTVKYFLTFREITGKNQEKIALMSETNLSQFLKLLTKKYGKRFEESVFDHEKKQLNQYVKILVNEKEVGLMDKLKQDDVVSILFPPSGG